MSKHTKGLKEAEASARLIAAAPEMYKVLKDLSYRSGPMEWLDAHCDGLVDKIENAIAKVEVE